MRKERPLFAADRHAVSPLGERCSGAGRYARLCTEAQGFDPGGAVAARPHRVPGGRGVFRNETIETVEVELLAARSDLTLVSTPTSAAPRRASSRRRRPSPGAKRAAPPLATRSSSSSSGRAAAQGASGPRRIASSTAPLSDRVCTARRFAKTAAGTASTASLYPSASRRRNPSGTMGRRNAPSSTRRGGRRAR